MKIHSTPKSAKPKENERNSHRNLQDSQLNSKFPISLFLGGISYARKGNRLSVIQENQRLMVSLHNL